MNTFLFIVWLIGAIVSIYVILKYVNLLECLKHIFNIFKNEQKISDKIIVLGCLLCITFVVVPGYVVLSWLGAIVTYISFNDFDKQ